MMINIELPCEPPATAEIVRERNILLGILGITIIIITLIILKSELLVSFALVFALMFFAFFMASLTHMFKIMNNLSAFKWALKMIAVFSLLLIWLRAKEGAELLSYVNGFVIIFNFFLCVATLSISIALTKIIWKLDKEKVQRVYQAAQKSDVIYEYVESIKAMPKREMIVADYSAVFGYLDDNGIDYSDIVPDELE